MEHDVRLAGSADVAAVETVVRSAYSRYVERIGRKPGPMLDDYGALVGSGHVYVAETRGVIHGVLVLLPQGSAMLLDNVAVAPEAQGRGLGRELLAFAERRAADAGFRVIRLYTNEAMTENIDLYERIGYVETHRVVERGLRRVYMLKRLDP